MIARPLPLSGDDQEDCYPSPDAPHDPSGSWWSPPMPYVAAADEWRERLAALREPQDYRAFLRFRRLKNEHERRLAIFRAAHDEWLTGERRRVARQGTYRYSRRLGQKLRAERFAAERLLRFFGPR